MWTSRNEDCASHQAGESDARMVLRRKLLQIGTLTTAFVGFSATSSIGSGGAKATAADITTSTAYVPTAEKGTASGVATLDTHAQIPPAQLPDLSGIYASKADVIGPYSGAAGYCYGTSLYASDAMNTGAATRAVNLICAGLGLSSLKNYAVNGTRVQDMAVRALNNGGIYPAGTKSIVLGDFGLYNNQGDPDTSLHRAAAENSLRSLIATICASTRVEQSSAGMVFSAGWTNTAAASVNTSGGTFAYTLGDGAYVDINVPAGTNYLLLRGTTGAAGNDGQFATIKQGAATIGTLESNATFSPTTNLATENIGPVCVKLPGLSAGTIRVTFSKGGVASYSAAYIDALLPQSSTPPLVVIIKQVPSPRFSHINKPGLYAFLRGLPDQMRSEFGNNIIVVDPAVGWDAATMMGSDQLHYTDAGMAHVRNVTMAALKAEATRRTQQALFPGLI